MDQLLQLLIRVGIISSLVYAGMYHNTIFFPIGLVLFLVLMIWHEHIKGKEYYKKGQVDALSGRKVKYKLVTHPDSTVSWEEIK